MSTDTIGEYLLKVLDRQGKTLCLKTAFSLGMRMISGLEYVHSYEYILAYLKASSLLLDLGEGNENKIHLLDFGLACRYTQNGKYKEYKKDLRKVHDGTIEEYKEYLRKVHDGTIESASREAHIGAHARRFEREILGYTLLQCLCCRLPERENLKNPEYVSQQKSTQMERIT
ncbi:serine/threonine-protein kinase VRK1 [Rhipicephalus sanguineus]|uniref:Protein kinase domain-containing protein n=1 Tax=Rhipicephalus sanguineus TaxID=34632 RepID=A0A9D4TAH0_RHISA|nr:serine/threonine-protein kinase VRK1 [Rhipicephalus sanguineus]KAH7983778.1 hypothetical protein HPB52_014236 [Rhipicephalus sanguineus]